MNISFLPSVFVRKILRMFLRIVLRMGLSMGLSMPEITKLIITITGDKDEYLFIPPLLGLP